MKLKETFLHKKNNIKVYIRINYIKETISIVEPAGDNEKFRKKEYCFINQDLNKMSKWKNILSAINEAIEIAENKLVDYKREEGQKIIN